MIGLKINGKVKHFMALTQNKFEEKGERGVLQELNRKIFSIKGNEKGINKELQKRKRE